MIFLYILTLAPQFWQISPATYNETRKEIKGRSYQIRNSQPVRQ